MILNAMPTYLDGGSVRQLTLLGPLRNLQLEVRNASHDQATIVSSSKEGASGPTVVADHVVAVVGKFIARLDDWLLIHHSVTFHHDPLIVRLVNDPLTPENTNLLRRVVDDGDEVDERVRSILWCLKVRHVDDVIHLDGESHYFLEAFFKFRHPQQLFVLVNMARTQSKTNYRDSGKCITSETPIALTIAGSDSSGGAGLQADLKTFTSLGVCGLTAVTAVVAESSLEVRLIEPVSIVMLEAQLDILFATYPIAAVKTGMLPTEEQISVIAKHMASWKSDYPKGGLVVDPIIHSSTGTPLIEPGAMKCLERELLPLADLITPNIPEAQSLLNTETAEAKELGSGLAAKFDSSILLKGGHGSSKTMASDLLMTATGITLYETERIPGGHRLHGTGCTLSAAITAYLAQGIALEDAVALGKEMVAKAISQAYCWGPDLTALASPRRYRLDAR